MYILYTFVGIHLQTLEKRKHFAGLKRGRGGVPEQAKKAQKSAHSQQNGRERERLSYSNRLNHSTIRPNMPPSCIQISSSSNEISLSRKRKRRFLVRFRNSLRKSYRNFLSPFKRRFDILLIFFLLNLWMVKMTRILRNRA